MTIKRIVRLDGGAATGTLDRNGLTLKVAYAFDLTQKMIDAGSFDYPDAEIPGTKQMTVHIPSTSPAEAGDILTIVGGRQIKLQADMGGGVFNAIPIGDGWPS